MAHSLRDLFPAGEHLPVRIQELLSGLLAYALGQFPLADNRGRVLRFCEGSISVYRSRTQAAFVIGDAAMNAQDRPANPDVWYVRSASRQTRVRASPSARGSVRGIFAAMALLLASIGIQGVLSYLVAQRTQEIGVRMALGARHADVLRLVLVDGARMMMVGVAIGVLAALGLTHWMSSMLFGVAPTDPLTFVAVAAVLCGIGLCACYVPARRAMRADPILALRHE